MRRITFFCLVLLAISSLYVSGCANDDNNTQTILEEGATTTIDDRLTSAGMMKVAVSPSPDSQGVPVDTSISVTWNRVMKYATINVGSFTVVDQLGHSVAGIISFTGLTARFTPSAPLDLSTTYTATLSKLIQDAKLKHLPMEYSWSFTTAPDITPPTIISTSPVEGATGVPTYGAISVEFSEPIEPATIISPATTLSVVKTSDGTPIAGTVSMVGNNVARFTQSALLHVNTQYTATILQHH